MVSASDTDDSVAAAAGLGAVPVAPPPESSEPGERETSERPRHPLLHLTDEDLELKRLMYADEASRSPVGESEPRGGDKEQQQQHQQVAPEQQQDHEPQQQPPTDLSPGSSSGKTSGGGPAREQPAARSAPVELRLLVRRREAGALIGKRGANIKRLRENFPHSMFSIPDTGNGPERIVCIVTNDKSVDAILADITQLFMEKSPENDEQIELKLLIHSSHAGSIIGLGGQSIKKLRNDSKAAIKIYEMCCPLSNERVCAIKAKPPVVVSTIRLVHSILRENPIKGTVKPYDALHFDLNLVDKYGGYLPEEAPPPSLELMVAAAAHQRGHFDYPFAGRQMHEPAGYMMKPYSVWRSGDYNKPNRSDPNDANTPDGQSRNQTTPGSEGTSSPDHQRARSSPKPNGPSSGQASTRRPLDSLDQREQVHLARAAPRPASIRYHPYGSVSGGQMAYLAQAADRQLVARHQHLVPQLGPHPRTMHYAGHPLQQHRPFIAGLPAGANGGAALYPAPGNPPDRCAHQHHHERPCLCMFLPMAPGVVPPYVQLAENSGSPFAGYANHRSAAYGYKKK